MLGSPVFRRLFLNATPMGEPLYRDLGFHEQEERALVKRLSPVKGIG